jgi:TRAP-type C4-dicarboxylate transport system permease small subunit
MLTSLMKQLRRLQHLTARSVDVLLVAAVLCMVGTATAQIIARNLFDSGLLWADPLLRILVLWVALLGAVVAARRNKHLSIDVLSRFLSPRWSLLVAAVGHLFTATLCVFLAWHAARFVAFEKDSGTTALADVPVWLFELILPAALALIALRYLVHGIACSHKLVPSRRANVDDSAP